MFRPLSLNDFIVFSILLLFLSTFPRLAVAVCPGTANNVACNGNGLCGDYDRCICFQGADGFPTYRGYDCSELSCPTGVAWVSSEVVGANNVHPVVECSNKGTCNRKSGACTCFDGYDGLACERTTCPLDCSGNGICYTQMQLADDAGRVYVTPWDANKMTGCVCDLGFRGLDCNMMECPSGPDPLKVIHHTHIHTHIYI